MRCRCGRPARWDPFDAWPTGGGGFEHFYGFVGAETNQWSPALYRDTVPIEPDRKADGSYHFTEDLTDKAIEWVSQQKALMPDKPFFVYFAPGATHAPHHVPAGWSEKYRGQFDDGWDALRERTFARQKELGVIPADAELTARPAEIPAWDEMPDELKPVLARQMEVYAGFLEHTDHHLGRLVDSLAELEILDDTLGHLRHRRQRRVRRGHAARDVQRAAAAQRRKRAGDHGVHGVADREVRHAGGLQPLRGGLGARDGHAVSVDQAGRVALGRDPQRHDRALAGRHPLQRRGPLPVSPRDRHRGHRARRRRAAGADQRQRRPADAAARRQHGVLLRRPGRERAPRDPVLRDLRQPRHLSQGLDRGDAPQHAVGERRVAGVRRRCLGALRARGLDPGPRPRRLRPGQAARAPTPVPARGRQVQRVPARRPHLRALQRRHRRPPAAHQGQLAAAVRGHGPPDRELDPRAQEQIARRSRPRSRSPRPAPAA